MKYYMRILFKRVKVVKHFIVLCSTVILGIAIYNMIMGTGDESLINVVGELWRNEIETRTNNP